MKGNRVEPKDGDLLLKEGEYGKHPIDGNWYARPPGAGMANLKNHQVTEHEDGTITVSPSILVTWSLAEEKKSWHGFLERGVWR